MNHCFLGERLNNSKIRSVFVILRKLQYERLSLQPACSAEKHGLYHVCFAVLWQTRDTSLPIFQLVKKNTMQGHPEVLESLKDLLRGELAARDQYFIHSRQYEDLGFTKLYERMGHEMEEETQHADAILRRILMLGGKVDMRPHEVNVGQTVPEMLRKDLETEYSVQKQLKNAMALCEQHRDYVSRDMLLAQLRDTEEDHAYWLEKQIGLIEKIGLQNYLQSQSQS